ncbi:MULTISPECIES: hypothetical protein [unclassified Agrobacterium]|uniref:hypothetical protein n=1 Tax=unclassified Agrobacterium TaxID=2632611 RepID=UPI00244D5392|nr:MULTISPECIES: hypothetical protein [unclassified Agrobacterium]MDH0614106.1 hypothetical protein [Agrobacterium sp. GD03872]MDH0695599.1 hypothetical protein [Agrobacterium sp. GD03871]MDH1058501.1 hypothetical protein [Agrobacterium sp. GD03992]MDH2209557.1 hypothetical protein [Agrobacterium sp. GD03643]MDH2218961.1 hypothetical protein [Agrobacterium sp. GD03638]
MEPAERRVSRWRRFAAVATAGSATGISPRAISKSCFQQNGRTPAVNNFIAKAAQLATDLGWQAGEPASKLAGQIISVLAAHPEHTDRFLDECGELFIDGTFDTANGSLTYRSLRAQKGNLQ